MIAWPIFGKLALSVVEAGTDDDLREILTDASQPPRVVDDVGRPLPNSALINQHPDPNNYSRIIKIRRAIAVDKKEQDYIKYADAIITFLDSFGPFSESDPLWLILIATHKNQYEFLYAPKTNAITGMPVGHLNNSDKTSN
jgi:hypothetical protein